MRKRTAAILFGGIGGFTAGLKRSMVEAYGDVHTFEILCSIDFDPTACKNHDIITGEQTAVQMDLFNRDQYTKWFDNEPPPEWREVTPWDVWQAFREQVPDYIFLSPPCKGFSGLLPSKSAASQKYQALNLLTIRGLELCLQACLQYGDELPAFIHFENVPRITSRGKDILNRIKKLLKQHGYAVDMRTDHNLGEIGGLGQNRMRFLLLARNEKRVPNFCYLPPKKPLKTIGDVIGPLPMPDDPAGGPMHRLPRLQWKTWVRLALIPAGGDWRDLNKIDWENYRIVHEPRGGAYAVEDWDEPSRVVTGTAGPGRSNGAAAVSDPRIGLDGNGHAAIYRVVRHDEPAPCVTGAHRPNNGAITISDPRLKAQEGKHPGVYRIVRVDESAPTITGTRFGSGAIAIADPRLHEKSPKFNHAYKVSEWSETGGTVTGGSGPSSGGHIISDPRVNGRENRYTDQYRMQSFDGPAATVTGTRDVQAGAPLVADPRVNTELMPDSYGVQSWDDTAKTVRGNSRIMQSASSIADPRLSDRGGSRRSNGYTVRDWEQPAHTITGEDSLGSGAQSIADPRISCAPRSGTMGVQCWDEPAKTVIGSGDIHAGAAAVADPRIPDDRESGTWVIIAEDGTWHRPLTTYELAMLQGFPMHLPDGRPFQLEGCSDAKAREYIGNAVPPPAAEAMGNVILIAMANAEAGVTFEMSHEDVWVLPDMDEQMPAVVH